MATPAEERKRRQEIANILSKQTDIGALTDDELQSRLSMLKEFGVGGGRLIDQQKLGRGIAEIANTKSVRTGFDQDANPLGNTISSLAVEIGRYPTAEEIQHALTPYTQPGSIYTREYEQLKNFINDQDSRNAFGANIGAGSYDAFTVKDQDIKTVEELLAGRKDKSAMEAELGQYIEGLPAELTNSRQDYLSSLTSGAERQFGMESPKTMALLNSRGALNSGAAGDLLASTAGEIYEPIQRIQAQLEAEDNAFYANMAYQNKVRQLLETSADWRTSLDVERANVRSKQNQDFISAQDSLNSQYNSGLQEREYERALQATKARLDAASKEKASSLTSGLIKAGTKAGGSIVGSAVGGPVGGYVGGELGGEMGGGFY